MKVILDLNTLKKMTISETCFGTFFFLSLLNKPRASIKLSVPGPPPTSDPPITLAKSKGTVITMMMSFSG